MLMGIAGWAQGPTVFNMHSDHVRLKARVLGTVPVDSFNGKLISTDFHPSFTVTLRIESIDPTVDGLLPGAVVTFGIHSPALLFRTEQTKGRSYALCLRREVVNGKAEFTSFVRLAEKDQCFGSFW